VECEFDTLDAKSIAFVLAVALLSYALTWLAIRYAHRRLLLDLPGRRRSHSAPTPRGGGIAIVLAMLAAIVALPAFAGCLMPSGRGRVMMASIALVAVIGWVDDHRPLSARLRLFVHFLAAAIVIHSGIGAFAIGGSSGGCRRHGHGLQLGSCGWR
jgi:UDP-N-acetylmuramyl pentapeptide phosphotransferase/UDP-N-acetylglucosamine-1-phosphate transferase